MDGRLERNKRGGWMDGWLERHYAALLTARRVSNAHTKDETATMYSRGRDRPRTTRELGLRLCVWGGAGEDRGWMLLQGEVGSVAVCRAKRGSKA